MGLLGLAHLKAVRTARVYVLEFDHVSATAARSLADQAVEKLLANPVIHSVTVRPTTP